MKKSEGITRRDFIRAGILSAALGFGLAGKASGLQKVCFDKQIHNMNIQLNPFVYSNDFDIVLVDSTMSGLEAIVDGIAKPLYNDLNVIERCPVIRKEDDTLMVYFLALKKGSGESDGRIMKFPYPSKLEPVDKENVRPTSDTKKYHFLDVSPNGDLIKRTWDGKWYLENRLLIDATTNDHIIANELKVLPYHSLNELEISTLKQGKIYRTKVKKNGVYKDKIVFEKPEHFTGTGDYFSFELIVSDNNELQKIVSLQGDYDSGKDLFVFDLSNRTITPITRDRFDPKKHLEREKIGLAVSRDGKYAYVCQGTKDQVMKLVPYNLTDLKQYKLIQYKGKK